MNQKQAKIVSFVSLVLGMFGFICAVCISQGIALPFEEASVRTGTTVIVPIDIPVNIDTDQELSGLDGHPGWSCDGDSCSPASEPVRIPEITIAVKPPRPVSHKVLIAEASNPDVVHVSQSEKLSFESIRPGAARRRPAPVSRETPEEAREDGSSVEVLGGAVWATDEALEYDPMNGEL